MRAPRPATAAIVLSLVLPPVGLAGQAAATARGTTIVTPGAHYRAGWLHRLFFGAHHRDLWATPLAVEVLDLSTTGGGLTPQRCGGRRQTRSLRFAGADGHEYVFRSVDKDPTLALPPELRRTFAREIIQDQISSAHPAGPLVVAPLLGAADVLHAAPRMVVMPENPRLAAFDCVRPGMLGTIEERPTEGPDNEPGFAGAADLAGTAKLFDLLEDDPAHRVDARAFLAARLMDLYIGDWDRHQDQWQWARFDEGRWRWWRPIPRDRDQAFSRLDGVLLWIAGYYLPQLVGFDDDYPSVFRLTWTGHVLDRRLLVDLERPVWDSVAHALQARLTDSVIAGAVRQLPPEYRPVNGPALERALRNRRDRLPDAAARFYALVSNEVDVHATDVADSARVERLPDGRMRLRLTARGLRYFDRTFDARETRELRLYLHGGDDRAVVAGRGQGGGGPLLRLIGGDGDDRLVDSARVGKMRFYDDRGENRVVAGPGTSVDRRRYREPPADTVTLGRPRDWGSSTLPLLWLSFAPDVGLFIGGGLIHTRYGFRALPYRSRIALRAAYATSARSYRAEFVGDFRGPLAPATLGVELQASGLEVIRFYGFGNETPATGSDEFFQVRQEQYLVAPDVGFPIGNRARLAVGPVLLFARTESDASTFLTATGPYYGAGEFGQVGVQGSFELDTRDVRAAPSRGVHVRLAGAFYPTALDVTDAFGALRGEASTYLSLGQPSAATLAVRLAGAKVAGTAPFHEAAFLGGANTVRGYPEQRFAGEASLYGNAEVRLRLGSFFVLLPGDIGVFGLADAGRVFVSGESSDRWHAAAGGGLWFAFLNRANTVTIAAARSPERTAVYVRAGFMF